MNRYDLSQRLMPLRGYAANCVDAADQRHHDKSHEVLWLYRLLPVIDAFIGTWAHGCELCLDFDILFPTNALFRCFYSHELCYFSC